MIDISKAEAIGGWMTPVELYWLAETAAKCQTIIEIGSYHGRSTVAMLDNSQATVYCVDPMDGQYFDNDNNPVDFIEPTAIGAFKINTQRFGSRVRLIQLYSTNPELWDLLPGADFCFIDGDHRYDTVMNDIKLAKWTVRSGGIIGGHDYGELHWPGVQAAVDWCYPKINRVGSIWYVTNQ